MKIRLSPALSASLLLAGNKAATVLAQGPPEDEILQLSKCHFERYWYSGTGLDATSVTDFTVAAGASVTCRLMCRSGGTTNVYLKFDGAASSGDNSFSSENNGNCEDIVVVFITTGADTTTLGYEVSVDSEYQKVGMVCYCSDDGSGIPYNLAYDALEALRTSVESIEAQAPIGCFSESSLVSVRNKKGDVNSVAMRDLEVGDEVLTDGNSYQPLYAFGHRDPNSKLTEFYRVAADGIASPLELTGNHMVALAAGGGHVRADLLKVGDRLLAAKGDAVVVTKIDTVTKRGLYMPLTPNGKIAVNGIISSNYISLADEAPAVSGHSDMFFSLLGGAAGAGGDHLLSHWWLSPLRMLCMGVSSGFCGGAGDAAAADDDSEQDRGILHWLVAGRKLAAVAESQPALVRVVVFGIPAFVVLGMFNAVEHVFLGPSFAPGLVLLMIGAWVFARKMKKAETDKGSELTEKLLA